MRTRRLAVVVLGLLLVHCGGEGNDDSLSQENPELAKVRASKDVPWLEGMAGSLVEAQKGEQSGLVGGNPKDLRTAAYARLGELASKASPAAQERLEKSVRGASITPATVPADVWTHPAWHFEDMEVDLSLQAKAPDGTVYAVIGSWLLGDVDFFMMESKTPEDKTSWSRPKLLPGTIYPGMRDFALRFKEPGVLVLSFVQAEPPPPALMDGTYDVRKKPPSSGPQEREYRLEEVFRDQDGDGWTDLEEARLGLDPKKADTDGDGIADGMDRCPNFAPPKGEESDEEAQILQKAIFAALGLSGSRHLLIVGPKSRRVQVWGYLGPILYTEKPEAWREEHQYGAIFVDWTVERKGSQASVEIVDEEGPLAAGSQTVHLKKVRGKWTVTKRELGWVS